MSAYGRCVVTVGGQGYGAGSDPTFNTVSIDDYLNINGADATGYTNSSVIKISGDFDGNGYYLQHTIAAALKYFGLTFGTVGPAQTGWIIETDSDKDIAIRINGSTVARFKDGGDMSLIGNLTSNNFYDGVYTPTVTNSTNTDAPVTCSQAQYQKVGTIVTVSGRFTANPTAPGTASFEMSLPVDATSNFGAAEDASGVAFCGAVAGQGAEITANVANDTMQVTWVAADLTNQSWSFICTYQAI